MRFDLNLRSAVREQVENLAETIKSWEERPRLTEHERKQFNERITFFTHTVKQDGLRVAGVASGGDFPSICYGSSFVYATVAHACVYETDALSGLREVGPAPESVFNIVTIPDDEDGGRSSLDGAFSALSGTSLTEVIEASDYSRLKAAEARRSCSFATLARGLIRPSASDAGNISIQLRSVAEYGAALRLINSGVNLSSILIEGTLSLPFVARPDASLFYEHLKRLCCIEASRRGVGLFTISQAHSVPSIELLEEIAREHTGRENSSVAEHWYLRLPVPKVDDWNTILTRSRRLPAPGAVTYLVRFHRTTSTMRLDMDRGFWLSSVLGTTEDETRARERHIFENLDYITHDQRHYGYPYPLRAAHDRARLTKPERSALRKQIIDAGVHAGLKRALFREPAQSTIGG
jgi:hypothetical protein